MLCFSHIRFMKLDKKPKVHSFISFVLVKPDPDWLKIKVSSSYHNN